MATHYEQGQYMGAVKEQGFGESSNGNPQIIIKIQPYVFIRWENGVETEENLPDNAWERTVYLTVTENTREFVLEKLRAAGFQGSSFRELNLVGKSVRLRCSHETDNKGKDREVWDLVYQSESKPLQPLDTAAARKLDAIFGSSLKDLGKAGQSPAPSQPASVPVPDGDDEVPF